MIDGFAIEAVVAMARNRVIGAEGGMPWRLPSDLATFRRLTTGCPMIMGRRTLDSIGRLLPDRDTIVLTRGGAAGVDGVLIAGDADEALAIASEAARRRAAPHIAVVGGAEVYAALLPRTDRIHLTRIEAEPPGDTIFPAFEDEFDLEARGELVQGDRDSAPFRLERWVRRAAAA